MPFKKPTLFVVGAGASLPYGYPLGYALVDRVQKKCASRENDPLAKTLHDLIGLHDPLSIDSFLGQHCSHDEALTTLGKELIAECILECEDPENLKKGMQKSTDPHKIETENRNWYRFLVHSMFQDREALLNPEIPLPFYIVTFNYDVSLEYYFISRVLGADALNTEEKKTVIGKIEKSIAHVYGAVRDIPWECPQRMMCEVMPRPYQDHFFTPLIMQLKYSQDCNYLSHYGLKSNTSNIGFEKALFPYMYGSYNLGSLNPIDEYNPLERRHKSLIKISEMDYGKTFLKDAAKRISVIGEGEREKKKISKNLEDAYAFMQETMERIIFLGFGFDAENMERLFSQEVTQNPYVRKKEIFLIRIMPIFYTNHGDKANIHDFIRNYGFQNGRYSTKDVYTAFTDDVDLS